MISTEQLKQVFNDKLVQTGSLDAAFTKAVWVAYKQGIEDGQQNTVVIPAELANISGAG